MVAYVKLCIIIYTFYITESLEIIFKPILIKDVTLIFSLAINEHIC